MAALLKRQNPIGRAVSVWWPGGRVATKAFAALPAITSSTACTAPPAARKAASKLPGDIVVSTSSPIKPSFGVASRMAVTYCMGWQSAMVSSAAAGASARTRARKRSCPSARSMARSRSGRSGWQAGWVMRSVDIGLSENGVGHIYSRGVPPRPTPRRSSLDFGSAHRGWPVGKASADAPNKYGHHGRIYSLPSFSGDADAGWRRRIIGHEEGGRERLARVHAVFLEVGDALGGEEGVVDQEVAGEAA